MIDAKIDLDLSALEYVKGSGMNRAIRMGFNKAMKPVKEAVVANAPADKSNLKKSIKIKVKYYAGSRTWAGVVGPSLSYKRVKPQPKKKPKKAEAKKTTKKTVMGNPTAKRKRKSKLQRTLAKTTKTIGKKAKQAKKGLKLGVKWFNKLTITKNFKKAVKKKIKKFNQPKKQYVRPARYAHLVNWGSSKMQGRKFLERSMSQTKAKFATDLAEFIKAKLAEQLDKK